MDEIDAQLLAAQIHESELRYRQLFDNMAAGFALHEIICDRDGVPCDYRFLEVNPAFERLTGLQAATLIGRTLREVLPNTEERWIRFFGQVALTGEPAETEDYSRELDRWHEVRAFSPRRGQFAVIFTEVTVRKRAEAAIAASERTYREIFNSTSDALFIHDVDGQIVDVNRQMCELYGCTREQALSLSLADLSLNEPPYDLAYAASMVNLAFTVGPQVFSWRARRCDGSLFWAEVSLRAGDIAGIRRVIAAVRDVTDSRRNALALADNTQRLRLAIAAAHFAVWDWDIPNDRIDWDERMFAIYGLDPRGPAPSYRMWLDTIHPDDRALAEHAVTTALGGGPPFDIELRITRPDGTSAIVKANGTILFGASGEPERMVGFNRDVTALREMEERLRQADKMNAIGQLAGGVAHDFNNQLSGILGFAEILRRHVTSDTQRRYVDHIITAGRRSADITSKLLAFSRKGQIRNVILDLHTIVGETIAILSHSIDRRIEIISELGTEPALVQGDPSQLQNALLNLGLNARDAMPNGGQLRFTSSIVQLSTREARELSLPSEGAYVRLRVSDQGVGMDETVRAHLFEPFFTTKAPGRGTGMGLASVYGTIRAHHGCIAITSKPQHGTTITLHFPAVAPLESTTTTSPALSDTQRRALTILTVDDDELIRTLLADMLIDAGHTVHPAANGKIAINLYRQHWPTIDVVLLDMIMPEMSGHDCFQALKMINPKVVVLLASGYSRDGEAAQIIADGARGFIQKPFTRADLLRQLQEIAG